MIVWQAFIARHVATTSEDLTPISKPINGQTRNIAQTIGKSIQGYDAVHSVQSNKMYS